MDIKILGGDVGEGEYFATAKSGWCVPFERGGLTHVPWSGGKMTLYKCGFFGSKPVAQLEDALKSVELITSETTSRGFVGRAAAGAAGALILGPVGLLAGALAGGGSTKVNCVCTFENGEFFIANVKPDDFAKLRSLVSTSVSSTKASAQDGRYCGNCGKLVPLEAHRFCSECGFPLAPADVKALQPEDLTFSEDLTPSENGGDNSVFAAFKNIYTDKKILWIVGILLIIFLVHDCGTETKPSNQIKTVQVSSSIPGSSTTKPNEVPVQVPSSVPGFSTTKINQAKTAFDALEAYITAYNRQMDRYENILTRLEKGQISSASAYLEMDKLVTSTYDLIDSFSALKNLDRYKEEYMTLDMSASCLNAAFKNARNYLKNNDQSELISGTENMRDARQAVLVATSNIGQKTREDGYTRSLNITPRTQ